MRFSPNETALINIVEARMKIIRDALPKRMIIFLTMCCPTTAAMTATRVKYPAVEHLPKFCYKILYKKFFFNFF